MLDDVIDIRKNAEKALRIAWSYGQIYGEEHKMWVIDQMVRALFGDDKKYADWVKAYETPAIYGGEYFEWNMGYAP